MIEQIFTFPILAIMTVGLIAWMKEGGYEGHRVDKSGLEDITEENREFIAFLKHLEELKKQDQLRMKQEEEDNEKTNRKN